MPQPSIAYACGRIGAISKHLLKKAQLERLLATQTYLEASKALLDIGFMNHESEDVQAVADEHVGKAIRILKEISPCTAITNCYLYRYDMHNLKVLVKARQLGIKPQFLTENGVLPLAQLQNAVTERRYGALPNTLKLAMYDLEKQLAKQFDPLLVDARLDQAMMNMVFSDLKAIKDNSVKQTVQYFRTKADVQNTIMLLRARGMGKDFAFFEKVYLPHGTITLRTYALAFTDQAKLSNLLRSYGEDIDHFLKICVQDKSVLPRLEALADDYLYALFADSRYQVDCINVLVRYLLTVQREAINIRLVMTSKRNGFTQEEVIGRVRELNG